MDGVLVLCWSVQSFSFLSADPYFSPISWSALRTMLPLSLELRADEMFHLSPAHMLFFQLSVQFAVSPKFIMFRTVGVRSFFVMFVVDVVFTLKFCPAFAHSSYPHRCVSPYVSPSVVTG